MSETVYVLLDLKHEWDDYGAYIGVFSTPDAAQASVRIGGTRSTGAWQFKENVGAFGAYDASYTDGEFRRVWRVLPQQVDALKRD